MALPAYPNAISLNAVNVELGREATITISLNDAIVRTLFVKSSGAIAMSDGHGKSNASLPPTLYSFSSGDYEVGQTITAYYNNPNNTGLAYTASWTARNADCWGNNYGAGYYYRSATGNYNGTLAGGGVSAISGPSAINGRVSYYYGNSGIGSAAMYTYSVYFPSLNLTLASTSAEAVNIRGANYQHTVWYDDECCRNGGCESGCNGSSTHEECNDNCCCYDCNVDGITACGDPADPNYDDSNPPCQRFCGDGVTDACGQSCNNACDNGSMVNCPYSQEETTYDILYNYSC